MSLSGHLTPNSFSSYHLTDEDTLEGSILSTLQKQVIQNKLAIKAEQRLAMQMDANNPLASLQEEAALAGEILAYRNIIVDSELAVEIKNNPQPQTAQ